MYTTNARRCSCGQCMQPDTWLRCTHQNKQQQTHVLLSNRMQCLASSKVTEIPPKMLWLNTDAMIFAAISSYVESSGLHTAGLNTLTSINGKQLAAGYLICLTFGFCHSRKATAYTYFFSSRLIHLGY